MLARWYYNNNKARDLDYGKTLYDFEDALEKTLLTYISSMKVLLGMHLYMMQGDLLYSIDRLSNRRLFKHIVQLLSLPQRRALFEKRSRNIFRLGSRESLE